MTTDAHAVRLIVWGALTLATRLTFWVFLIADIAHRWGQPLIVVATGMTVVWVVAWLFSLLGAAVLKAEVKTSA